MKEDQTEGHPDPVWTVKAFFSLGQCSPFISQASTVLPPVQHCIALLQTAREFILSALSFLSFFGGHVP